MDIVTRCAECLNQGLINLAMKNASQNLGSEDAYARDVHVANGKSYIFNACTVALIACVVFGIYGAIAPVSAVTVGACLYFGRIVADESFNVMVPNLVKYFVPNILKPCAWLSFGEIVIFYGVVPRNPFG